VILIKGWGGNPVPETFLVAAVAILFIPFPPVFGWTNDHLYPLNGPAWSLFFELLANMVYAVVARFLSWRIFAVALPVLAALSVFTVMRHTETVGPGWLWPHFDAGLARVMFGFFAGVAIYRFRLERGIPAIPAWLGVALLLAIFAVPATGIWRQGFDALAGVVLMPLLVAFVSGAKISGWRAKLCAALGMLSYGVYVLHVPLLGVTALSFSILHIEIPYGFLSVILVALVAGLAAALAHRVYDAPLRRWLSGVFPAQARATKPHVPAGEAG
jgi:peptidoglycan/LPS O-acetylase OafA/YrhL